MKKFFTVIPLQKKGQLTPYIYAPIGNEKLRYDKKINFPILSALHGYAEEGETVSVIAVGTDNDDVKNNLELLKEQLDAVCKENGCKAEVTPVFVPAGEQVDNHIATFQKLIDLVEDEDELFACLTFGTKLMSEVLRMAVQYALSIVLLPSS